MITKYSLIRDGNKFLTEHFQVKEFASIDGDGNVYSDEVLVDSEILDISERLYTYLGCDIILVNSGYRTQAHEMSLPGGVKNGYHTKGMAVDINCSRDGKILSAQEIACALEDLGWNRGIGLISKRAVHIDSRPNKYWFDEMKKCKSIGDSFYTYFKVTKKVSELDKAIDKLAAKKIIANPEFWKVNYNKEVCLQYTKDLILKFAKNIK